MTWVHTRAAMISGTLSCLGLVVILAAGIVGGWYLGGWPAAVGLGGAIVIMVALVWLLSPTDIR